MFRGSLHTESNASRVKLILRRSILECGEGYFVLSEAGKRYLLEELWVKEDKIFRVPFFCDNDKFCEANLEDRISMRYELGVKGTISLVIGELINVKNIVGVFDIREKIPQDFHRKSYLMFVGNGSNTQPI